MRIGKLAQITNIPISTIRYYDYQKLIPQQYMQKSPNGQRDFTEAAIPFLKRINTLIHAGIQIDDLRNLISERLTPETIERQVAVVRNRIVEIERKQAELETYKETLLGLLNNPE